MNKHQVKGVANQVTGEVKEQVGKLTGDRDLQARGHAREMAGKAQKQLGDVKETVENDIELRKDEKLRNLDR
jgi:uncharacterized protein YjbJ (UPF0337 family)